MVFLGHTKRIHFVGVGWHRHERHRRGAAQPRFRRERLRPERRPTSRCACRRMGAAIWQGHEGPPRRRRRRGRLFERGDAATTPRSSRPAARAFPIIPRGEMLAELLRLKYAVTVAGAHGKTSTTSLIASVLAQGGLDPTVIVGGKVRALSSNARLGGSRYVVAEADESDGQFVNLPSSVAVITNIDLEHLDYYPEPRGHRRRIPDVRQPRALLRRRDPVRGRRARHGARPAHRAPQGDVFAGRRSADISRRRASSAARAGRASSSPTSTAPLGEVTLHIPGDHYARNALAAVAAGLWLDIPFEQIKAGLEQWQGVGPPLRDQGRARGVLVVDDYGHHPDRDRRHHPRRGDELRPARRSCSFSRTAIRARSRWPTSSARCFDGAHRVFVTDIYPAGEKPIPGVSRTHHHRPRESTRAQVKIEHAPLGRRHARPRGRRVAQPGDIVITMGAGDIYTGRREAARAPRARRGEEGCAVTTTRHRERAGGGAAPRLRRAAAARTNRCRGTPPSGWADRCAGWCCRRRRREVARTVRCAAKHGIPYLAVGQGLEPHRARPGLRGNRDQAGRAHDASVRLNQRTVFAEGGASFAALSRKMTKAGTHGARVRDRNSGIGGRRGAHERGRVRRRSERTCWCARASWTRRARSELGARGATSTFTYRHTSLDPRAVVVARDVQAARPERFARTCTSAPSDASRPSPSGSGASAARSSIRRASSRPR